MEKIIVQYNNQVYKCRQYTPADEPDILAIVPAWRACATAVARIGGKSPQVPSAFSQAFCCLRLGLVENTGAGVDTFLIDKARKVLERAEIKATATPEGRSDIRLYGKNVTGREQAINMPIEMEFDELYWLAFTDIGMYQYKIYCILPKHIVDYANASKPDVRGGRVNVAFRGLVSDAGLRPVSSGKF